MALKAADLLANATNLVHDAETHDPEYFGEIFGPERSSAKIAHYLELADLLVAELEAAGAYPELREALAARVAELRGFAG